MFCAHKFGMSSRGSGFFVGGKSFGLSCFVSAVGCKAVSGFVSVTFPWRLRLFHCHKAFYISRAWSVFFWCSLHLVAAKFNWWQHIAAVCGGNRTVLWGEIILTFIHESNISPYCQQSVWVLFCSKKTPHMFVMEERGWKRGLVQWCLLFVWSSVFLLSSFRRVYRNNSLLNCRKCVQATHVSPFEHAGKDASHCSV